MSRCDTCASKASPKSLDSCDSTEVFVCPVIEISFWVHYGSSALPTYDLTVSSSLDQGPFTRGIPDPTSIEEQKQAYCRTGMLRWIFLAFIFTLRGVWSISWRKETNLFSSTVGCIVALCCGGSTDDTSGWNRSRMSTWFGETTSLWETVDEANILGKILVSPYMSSMQQRMTQCSLWLFEAKCGEEEAASRGSSTRWASNEPGLAERKERNESRGCREGEGSEKNGEQWGKVCVRRRRKTGTSSPGLINI